ncbi:MAG: lipid-A-disaccharide synthase-related protein [Vulcanimicrobiaceae bacterium]
MAVLFVANGHGETAIAARIARAAAHQSPGFEGDLLPLVGVGDGASPLRLVGPRRTMPSGGLVAMGNVRAFARDLRADFAGLLVAQLAFLRAAKPQYDCCVAVGDAYALALALVAGRPTIFVGTAKSVHVAPYGPFERSLLRRAARVFVRDAPTAALLRRRNVAAEAPGNVIVDLVDANAGRLPGTWLGLLPGSRDAAYGDAVRLARVARELGERRLGLRALVSIAPSLDVGRVARDLRADGWRDDDELDVPGAPFALRAGAMRLAAWSGELGTLLHSSAAVLGQAGTANEQAAACGVPVLALDDREARSGPWYRLRQRRLLGEALCLVPADPSDAADAIARLLADPLRLARMGAAGRERMGPPGGAAAIARAIARAIGRAAP